MITLTVISFNGVQGGGDLSASFDELGGTIGRADTNQFVLPDPERTISRVHAQVAFRNGKYAIIDRGSNPISVNGRPVGNGKEAPLGAGDQLQIGGYLIEVRVSAGNPKALDDPFADLLGPGDARAPSAPGKGRAAASVDPLAALDFEPTAPSAPNPLARGQSVAAPSGIPEDWDPFAPDPAPSKRAPDDLAQSLGRQGAANLGLDAGAAAPSALIPDLAANRPGNDNSLDSLFGLKPGGAGDPLAHSVLDAPMAEPNMAARQDPLQSLSSAPQASAATSSDAFSDLQLPFMPPPVARAQPPALPATTVSETRPPAPAMPSGSVLSWDSPVGDGRTVIRSPGRSGDAPPARLAAAPVAKAPPVAEPSPSAPPVASPSRPVPVPGSADPEALLAAFREGLAAPTVQIDALTPEVMRLIGQLLHEAARGTVDLLVARAALKREVRAESTMIVARENNPLKFSPSADAALHHLLAPPTRGFMPAAPAMRDAYDDLRAHQFGFIAGMRAALEGVLARFDPAVLEGRLTQRSMLESLLPSTRKARMWEVFIEHFEQISNDAADDFHTLFGKAFLKAYEEHIDQLKGDAA